MHYNPEVLDNPLSLILAKIKTTKAGSTQPILNLLRGIHLLMDSISLPKPILPKKSGTLKRIVVNTTALKTIGEPNFSGITLSRIKTIVIG